VYVNLKRTNEGKSPVFTHVAASLQGLTTIRALGAEETLISQFDDKQVIG
jgi:ATP-binding cassette subfamily C (CFTR/MRP) protein 4